MRNWQNLPAVRRFRRLGYHIVPDVSASESVFAAALYHVGYAEHRLYLTAWRNGLFYVDLQRAPRGRKRKWTTVPARGIVLDNLPAAWLRRTISIRETEDSSE